MIGLLSMAALATVYTENHGHLEARTTEYAQDKMEQLLALVYTDQVSEHGGISSGPDRRHGARDGRQHEPGAPVNGYVDWLEQNGDLLGGGATPPAKWFYQRVWEVTALTPTSSASP